ncbi:MAG TPA: CpaF family protein [Oscillatoriaceae cyanobacterium]
MFSLKRHQQAVPQEVTVTTEVAVEAPAVPVAPVVDEFEEFKSAVHAQFLDEAGPTHLQNDSLTPEGVELLRRLIYDQAARRGDHIPRARLDALHTEMMNEIRGLGPLEVLLADAAVSEIMVNHPHQVYVERAGRLTLSSVRFRDDAHLLRIIDRVVARVGRHIDEASPMCDARLPDGSRVNAIIPPLALNGPCLTIRRFAKEPLTIGHLIDKGSLTEHMALFLQRCVEAKLNILVSGGTGTGKTTVLNCLSAFIPSGERLITIEDAAELQMQQSHVVRLETRQPNTEGQGGITQAELLRNTLRMRPDRILIGEVRGGEALSMLQAMNTGHEGSLTTVHANTPRDALARLETMVLMAGMDLPHRAIREQVAAALDLIVQIERASDGKRRVSAITELTGMEGDVYLMQDIFRFQPGGRGPNGESLGQHRPTGIVPRCQSAMEEKGLALPLNCFRGEHL